MLLAIIVNKRKGRGVLPMSKGRDPSRESAMKRTTSKKQPLESVDVSPIKRKVALNRKHRIGISVSDEEFKMINEKAIRLNISRTELIVRAVEAYYP